MKIRLSWSVLIASLLVAACSDDAKKTCNLATHDGCDSPMVCEEVAGAPTCVAPVVVRGLVFDPGKAPIAGALVAGLDANDAPATGTVTSGSDGAYELYVPVKRTDDGLPTGQVKLMASASGFERFPSGLRLSLPIDLSTPVSKGGKLVVQTSATDVLLFPVANASGLGSLSGTVVAPAGKRGALVVAEGAGAAYSTISDTDGAYVLFNVPAGAYTVRGYAAGVQLNPASATVQAGAQTGKIDLAAADLPLGTVSGTLSIVNAPGGSATSVVLVVASTFNDVLKRGEVPPGLRAPRTGVPNVSGSFTITDVPDGDYVVLAAFENDGLVRDPDTSIGGTQIQHITVGDAGRTVTLSAGFKVTEALAVISPGAADVPDVVTGTPTFTWKDDSSEDAYTLEVFDSYGTKVWSTEVPKVTGGNASATYAGPALASGRYYQFRATSLHKGVPISQTEDLRGVFVVQ